VKPRVKRRAHRAALALCLFLLASACGSTTASPTPARPAPLEWVELLTGGAHAEDELPLIVAMHGRGDRAESFARAFEGFTVPARVALLRAPIAEGDGDAWFTFRRPDTWLHVAQDLDVAADRVVATIDTITAAHPTRGLPIAMGFSQGGNLAYTLALRHPTRFAAIFPVSSGLIDEALAWEQFDVARTPPIVAFHGTADEVIPIHVDRETIERLRGLGLRVELREHDAPHWIVDAMRTDLQAQLARAITGQ
jgi:phospholipase/carboxylesterase